MAPQTGSIGNGNTGSTTQTRRRGTRGRRRAARGGTRAGAGTGTNTSSVVTMGLNLSGLTVEQSYDLGHRHRCELAGLPWQGSKR